MVILSGVQSITINKSLFWRHADVTHTRVLQAMFVDFHLDKYFTKTNQKCKFTRGIMPFGGPLEGYKNTSDSRLEQQTSKYSTCLKVSRKHRSKCYHGVLA